MPNAFIRKLNDKDGNVILPASRAAGIYFDDDSVLQDYVASKGVMKKALGDKNGKDLTSYVTGLSVNGRTITFTRGNGTSGTIQTQDTNTTYSTFKGATSSAAGGTGLVPAPTAGQQTRFLRGDGTWQTPPNTTYSTFKAATASAAGGSGLVPAPAAGENDEYLRGDGTWATPPNTTYTNATSSKAGLMSSTDKAKLDGIASGANKTTVDTALSTSSTNPVRNSVVTTALNGKASTSHTHSAATTSTAGFMSAADKTLLNSLSNSVVVDTSWGSTVSDIP